MSAGSATHPGAGGCGRLGGRGGRSERGARGRRGPRRAGPARRGRAGPGPRETPAGAGGTRGAGSGGRTSRGDGADQGVWGGAESHADDRAGEKPTVGRGRKKRGFGAGGGSLTQCTRRCEAEVTEGRRCPGVEGQDAIVDKSSGAHVFLFS